VRWCRGGAGGVRSQGSRPTFTRPQRGWELLDVAHELVRQRSLASCQAVLQPPRPVERGDWRCWAKSIKSPTTSHTGGSLCLMVRQRSLASCQAVLQPPRLVERGDWRCWTKSIKSPTTSPTGGRPCLMARQRSLASCQAVLQPPRLVGRGDWRCWAKSINLTNQDLWYYTMIRR
jgi:hypothetical protein